MPVQDRLKAQGLDLGRLSLGTATQGGLFRAVSDEAAHAVFETAWQAGLRYYDTAPWYGLGLSEERLGVFLKARQGAIISTKIGRILREDAPAHPSQFDPDGTPSFETSSKLNAVYDYSYDGVMRSFEDSLTRMGLDRVDILYIHDPDVIGARVQDVMAGGHKALAELRDQGVIKAIGAGMNQWEMPFEFAKTGGFDLFLLAGRYTLLEQTSLEFMNYCAEHGIGVVIGGVYNSGLLANPREGAHYNYGPVPADVLSQALNLKAACEALGVSLKAAALQFPMQHPAVASVLTAARVPEQLADNLNQLQTPVPAEVWQTLTEQGFIAT